MKDTENLEWLPLVTKLPGDIRDRFKDVTHERKTTMQDVSRALICAYVENPDRFNIKSTVSVTVGIDV